MVFVAVSIDKDKEKWLATVGSGLYTDSTAVNLYTNGKGVEHRIIDELVVVGYPTPFLLDREGRIVERNASRLGAGRTGSDKMLIEAINGALAAN